MRNYIFLILLCLFAISCSSATKNKDDLSNLSWDEITQKADGQTVNWMMLQASPFMNNYINKYVVPEVKKRYNINLEISNGQGNQIVSTLMTEVEADKDISEVDIAWINGETFYQLRQIDALYGPFARRLPNAEYVNFDNPFINTDFQQKIKGYEAPWSITQFVMVYNRAHVDNPPKNMEELEAYVKANPGTFTIPDGFTGYTFLKTLMMDIAGNDSLYGKFDEQKYQKYSTELWEYINRLKPYLWKEGETFPSESSTLIQMFSSGELTLGMSFGTGSLGAMVNNGFLPKETRAYLWDNGTIQNTSYIGIVKKSGHKAGAMVVADFLLSPEAQFRKMQPQVLGSRSVLDVEKLPKEWADKFKALPESRYAPGRKEMRAKALQELGPEYMIHLADDFRTNVIQK